MSKHTPATPLPITTACDEEFRANAEDGRKYRVEQERRANAYPLLVGALRDSLKHDKTDMVRELERRALLRSLGEE